jgi:outer membrane lipoprotein SlyB
MKNTIIGSRGRVATIMAETNGCQWVVAENFLNRRQCLELFFERQDGSSVSISQEIFQPGEHVSDIIEWGKLAISKEKE